MNNSELIELLDNALEMISENQCVDSGCDCEGNESYKAIADRILKAISELKKEVK